MVYGPIGVAKAAGEVPVAVASGLTPTLLPIMKREAKASIGLTNLMCILKDVHLE